MEEIIPVTNQEIADVFIELANKIELIENGPAVSFKKKTYLTTATVIKNLPTQLESAYQLSGIKGIGKSVIEKVKEILETGTIAKLSAFKDNFSNLLKIDGVGPVKAKEIFETYGVRSAAEIQILIDNGTIKDERLALNVKRALMLKGYRLPLNEIIEISTPIEFHIRLHQPDLIVQTAGSIRRQKETCKDIDILICAKDDKMAAAKETYLQYPWDMLTAQGNSRIDTVKDGVAVQGWFLPYTCFGSGLMHCTGSGDFNQALRVIAKERNMKLSEYGLVHRETEEVISSWSEEEIFKILGFNFIPPKERSDGLVLDKYKL